MNVENLATVMGINLLKPQIEDPIAVMKGEEQTCGHLYNPEIHLNVLDPHFFIFAATPLIQKLMTVMISHHETLFPPSKDVLPTSPLNKVDNQKNTPRSFVGWESAEVRGAGCPVSPHLCRRCLAKCF